MLKITGVILCVAGCSGYGMLIIAAWDRGVAEVQQWIVLFEKMRSLIYYQREILEEICCHMNQEIYGPGGKYVTKVGEGVYGDRSKGFAQIWKEQMGEWSKDSSMPLHIKKIIMNFPDYAGEKDCNLQLGYLDLFIESLKKERDLLEREIREKKKPVMTVSVVVGIVISLLFI